MEISGLKDYEIDYLRYVKRKHNFKAHWDDEKKQDIDLSYL